MCNVNLMPDVRKEKIESKREIDAEIVSKH